MKELERAKSTFQSIACVATSCMHTARCSSARLVLDGGCRDAVSLGGSSARECEGERKKEREGSACESRV